MILLTPGPANTTRTVKEAMCVDDVCHREKVFADILASIRRDLLILAGAEKTHDVVLFTGSGTCAVDAAISSAVAESGRLLVLVNGAYGVRMARMAEIYRVPFDTLETAWHERPDPTEVERLLDRGSFTHLAMVHHETSTGILNPLESIAALCRERGVVLVADTISSFAGIPVPPADIFLASANKCLQGMPGLSFVFGRHGLLRDMADIPPRSFYTSLRLEHAAVEKSGQMRFTPAVQVALALRQALDETLAETLAARYARYRANWEALRSGLLQAGFRKLLPDEYESGLLTSFEKPTVGAYDFDRHHDLLFEAGYTIYPAMVGYEHTFRLGNIGQITTEEIDAFLQANAAVLKTMGVHAPFYS